MNFYAGTIEKDGDMPRGGRSLWGRYALRVTDSIRLDDEVRRRSFEDQVEHDAGPRRALDGSTFLVTESDHVTDVQPDAVSPVKVAADDLGIGRDRACGLEDLELNPVGKGHAERASLAGRVGELEANLPGRPQAVLERTVDRVGADHSVPRVTYVEVDEEPVGGGFSRHSNPIVQHDGLGIRIHPEGVADPAGDGGVVMKGHGCVIRVGLAAGFLP